MYSVNFKVERKKSTSSPAQSKESTSSSPETISNLKEKKVLRHRQIERKYFVISRNNFKLDRKKGTSSPAKSKESTLSFPEKINVQRQLQT